MAMADENSTSDRLGQRQPTTPRSPMKRKSSMHRVHHHRRTSSVLTAGLGILAEKYSALSAECLRTLRVEMQLEAIYHLQVGSSNGHAVASTFLHDLGAAPLKSALIRRPD